jgi:L-rhamnose mutarotase
VSQIPFMKTILQIAQLKPEMIEHYEKLHREIPTLNLRHMREGGYQSLQIYRAGTTLVMVLHHDEQVDIGALSEFSEAAIQWQERTNPCFAKLWQEAKEIFTFIA